MIKSHLLCQLSYIPKSTGEVLPLLQLRYRHSASLFPPPVDERKMEELNPYNIAAVPRFSRPLAVHSAASSLRVKERMTRFELVPKGWKPHMLPLHHIRIYCLHNLVTGAGVAPADLRLMRPPSHSYFIPAYLPIPLTGFEPVSSKV